MASNSNAAAGALLLNPLARPGNSTDLCDDSSSPGESSAIMLRFTRYTGVLSLSTSKTAKQTAGYHFCTLFCTRANPSIRSLKP